MADTGMQGLDGIISKLMSDPGIMATVSEAVAGMKNSAPSETTAAGSASPDTAVSGAGNAGASPVGGAPDMQSLAGLASLLGGGAPRSEHGPARGGSDANRKKRCDLLNALKPYLNQHRRETIDYMLGIERLGNALKTVKKP